MQTVAQLEIYYAGKVCISYDRHSYGCSVMIRSITNQSANVAHSLLDDVDMVEPVGA